MSSSIPYIVFALLILNLPLSIYSKYRSAGHKMKVLLKMVCSTLFVAIGFTSIAIVHSTTYGLIITLGLVWAWVGDFLLTINDKRAFLAGIIFFLLTHVCYAVMFCTYNGFAIWDAVLYIVIISLTVLIYPKTNIKLGQMKIPGMVYALVISFMYVKALSSIYMHTLNVTATVLIVAGATLFVVSDMVLAFWRFHEDPHPALSAINRVTYFVGQGLIALSILWVS